MDTEETRRTVVIMQSYLSPHGIDISVLPHSCGVISRLAIRQNSLVSERILAVRIDIFGIHSERETIFELQINTYIGVDQSKRTNSHFCTYMCAFRAFKIRLARGEIYIPCRTKLTSRLEDIRLLAIEQLYLLHVIKREAA